MMAIIPLSFSQKPRKMTIVSHKKAIACNFAQKSIMFNIYKFYTTAKTRRKIAIFHQKERL